MNLSNSPLFTQKIYETDTPYNSHVVVFDQGSRRRLTVGHFNYSLFSFNLEDRFEDRYWGKLISQVRLLKKEIKKALILGLGGGTMAYLLEKFYEDVKTDGIEIDEKIIEIGKRYFYLSSLANLKVICDDAYQWVLNKAQRNDYDLIIVDVYKALEVPVECESLEFFQKIKDSLKEDGLVVINKVTNHQNIKTFLPSYLDEKIKPCFKKWKVENLKGALGTDNLLIFAWKS